MIFSHQRAVPFYNLFNEWMRKSSVALGLPQNLDEYAPRGHRRISKNINDWLEETLNNLTDSNIGSQSRHLTFSEVSLRADSDKPIIIIQTRGGAISSFTHDCRDILIGFLQNLSSGTNDIEEYPIGNVFDTNTGINISGETANKIFALADVHHRVTAATERIIKIRERPIEQLLR